MNRRELLKHSTAAAAVAALPITLPEFAYASFTKIPWPEVTGSISYLSTMNALTREWKANGGKITSLTPTQWDGLGNANQPYFTYHAQTGNLHQVDLQAKANETYLKSKYNPAYVNWLIEYGSYAHTSFASTAMHRTASALRGIQPDDGCSGPASYFYGGAGVLWGLIGLLVPEIAVFCFLAGLVVEAQREFLCA